MSEGDYDLPPLPPIWESATGKGGAFAFPLLQELRTAALGLFEGGMEFVDAAHYAHRFYFGNDGPPDLPLVLLDIPCALPSAVVENVESTDSEWGSV